MGFNKAKALEEAHKFVTQGKTARAIRQYQWIAENDPADLTLLNVIGDLYARDNNIPEALKYFYRLADAYSREGYKVKAIAIYKKISKIDRNTAEPMVRIAQLNAGLGLAREAREQYKNAFEFFDRTKQKDKALGILRELCQLDAQSPGLRLTLAQYAERSGESKEAADAYLQAAVLSHQHGDATAAESALKKAAELAPQNPTVYLYRARQALENQRPEEVEAILDSAPDLECNPQAKRLLLQSYLAASDLDAARGLLRDVFNSNPSDFSPVALFVERCIQKQHYDAALEVLTDVVPDTIGREEAEPVMETLRALWNSAPERIDIIEFTYLTAEKTADEAIIPDLLEALGSAYVLSGQLEKAEHAFARLVAREPENETYKDLLKQVVQKQGKEFIPLGQTSLLSSNVGLEVGSEPASEGEQSAVNSVKAANAELAITNSELLVREGLADKAMEELEKVLEANPDYIAIHKRILEICQDRLPNRAAQAAEVLAQLYAVQGDSTAAKRYREEALGLAHIDVGAQEASAFLTSQDATAGQIPVEVDGSSGLPGIDLSEPVGGQGTSEDESQIPPPQELSLEFQTSASGNLAATLAERGPAQAAPAGEETTGFNYEGNLQEIEFYLRYGFHNEARKAVSELETKFPEEPRVAHLRQRVEESGQKPDVSEDIQADAGDKAKDLRGREWDLPTSFSRSEVAGQWQALDHQPGEEASVQELSDATGFGGSADASGEYKSAPVQPENSLADLGSLLDELKEDSGPIVQAAEDDQTHYNLGVAFREMGLLDEAIGEFQKVVKGGKPESFSSNFLQGCTLLAACFMDKGMASIAAKWYSCALDAPGLDHEGVLALYYDLGIAFEKAGNAAAALEKFTEVYSQNIDFRDVAEKIRLLRQGTS